MKWICALLPLLLSAAQFWDEKPPPEWTDSERKQLLQQSPWAKQVRPQVDKKLARNRSGRVLWEMRSGAPPPMEGMESQQVTVRWESAAPLREILPADELMRYREHYVISISGLPVEPRSYDAEEDQENPYVDTALLRVKGRNPVRPEEVGIQVRREGSKERGVLVFYFPREYPIHGQDRDVSFEFSMGPIQLESIFQPREMMFQGKFEK